jgi:hypothetical protein
MAHRPIFGPALVTCLLAVAACDAPTSAPSPPDTRPEADSVGGDSASDGPDAALDASENPADDVPDPALSDSGEGGDTGPVAEPSDAPDEPAPPETASPNDATEPETALEPEVGETDDAMTDAALGDTDEPDDAPEPEEDDAPEPEDSAVALPEPEPEPWPEGPLAVAPPVTLVAEGRTLASGERLALRTGPAGRVGRVTLALTVTNRTDEPLSLGAPADWLAFPEGAGVVWETPPPASLAPDASAPLVLAADGLAATAGTTWDVILAVPGTDLAVTVRVVVPRPLRLIVGGDGGFIAASEDGGASFRVETPASGASDPTRLRSISWGEGRFFMSSAAGQAWSAYGVYATSLDGLSWTPSAVAPDGWTSQCTHAFGQFVCARSGAFTWSEDGRVVIHEATAWTPLVNALATDGTKLVGVGRNGRRAISLDGRRWTEEHPHALGNEYGAVTYGGGRFVAVGGLDNYVISTSLDGVSWTDQVWAPSRWARMTGVAWNGRIFLAAGANNDARPLWRSTDALTWENIPETGRWESYELLGAFDGLFYGVRRYADRAGLFRSTDGSVWQEVLNVPNTLTLRAIASEGVDRVEDTAGAALDPAWSAPGAGSADDPSCPGVSVEVDGLITGPTEPPATVDFGVAPAHGDTRHALLTLRNPCDRPLRLLGHPASWVSGATFALEGLPPVAIPARGEITLALAWLPGDTANHEGALVLPHDGPLSPLVADLIGESGAPLRVVGVGDGGYRVATTNYGATFAYEGWVTTTGHTRDLIRGACWGAGRFVGVGGNAESVSWVSEDGVSWRDHEAPGPWLADCAYGNGRFVAAGGAPLVSFDGVTWTPGPAAAPRHIRTLVFGGGVFVGGGDAGTIVTTTDGAAWERTATAGTDGFVASAWGGGFFVLVGENGAVASSRDGGATWLPVRIPGAGRLSGVAFASGRFYAGDGAAIHVSTDGYGWTRVNASGVVPRAGVGRMLLGWGSSAMHRSMDGGFTWTRVAAATGGLGVIDLAVEGP